MINIEVVKSFINGHKPERIRIIGANNTGERFDCKLSSYGTVENLLQLLNYNLPLALKIVLPDGKELAVV